jgi:hypothetical protein
LFVVLFTTLFAVLFAVLLTAATVFAVLLAAVDDVVGVILIVPALVLSFDTSVAKEVNVPNTNANKVTTTELTRNFSFYNILFVSYT